MKLIINNPEWIQNKDGIAIVIFIGAFLILLWAYHRIKYSNSNYGKFEYYLAGE